MEKKPSVSVLMSTYNGEKYLQEQIDSILDQKNVDVNLIIRDDGSSDNTKDIVKRYVKKYDSISFYEGKNLGVGKSFYKLLCDAPESDYYAFSDQDDIWLPDKLSRAISFIKDNQNEESQPIVYVSNQTIIDKNGIIIKQRFLKEPKHDLFDCINNNVLCGCTMVLNQYLRCFLTDKNRLPSDDVIKVRIHDTWIVLAANVVGDVIYDPDGRILYRQHNSNVGYAKNDNLTFGKKWIKDKYFRFITKKYKGIRSKTAKDLLEKYYDLIDEEEMRHLSVLAQANSLKKGFLILKDSVLKSHFCENTFVLLIKSTLGWI